MASGERYALLPDEILKSAAYHATPYYVRSVLSALAVQYNGSRNGSLALPVAAAQSLGVKQAWRVYAGLRILAECDLIVCTRRGGLACGGKIASMYALTWRGIDEPATGVTYDSGITVCPMPTHSWARWAPAADWKTRVTAIERRARGAKNPDTHLSGTGHTHLSGTESIDIVPPIRARTTPDVVPPSRVISEIRGRGPADDGIVDRQLTHEGPAVCESSEPESAPADRSDSEPSDERGTGKIRKLLLQAGEFTDHDVAKITGQPIELVQRVRVGIR